MDQIKAHFGGALPACKGKKYKYPSSEDGWRSLFAKALMYQTKMREGKIKVRNYKFEYILYHARDKERKRRSQRNKDRKTMRENGHEVNGKEVHHMDATNLRRPVVLTKKEHDKMHEAKTRDKKMSR